MQSSGCNWVGAFFKNHFFMSDFVILNLIQLKVSKFQNEFMKSLFSHKNNQVINQGHFDDRKYANAFIVNKSKILNLLVG